MRSATWSKPLPKALCRDFRASPFYGRRFWVRPVLDSVCRTGTRLRSSTRIAYFHHYLKVRLADAVSHKALVRLLATVPAADTLLADPGKTALAPPFAPAEIEALTDDAGALTPFAVSRPGERLRQNGTRL